MLEAGKYTIGSVWSSSRNNKKSNVNVSWQINSFTSKNVFNETTMLAVVICRHGHDTKYNYQLGTALMILFIKA